MLCELSCELWAWTIIALKSAPATAYKLHNPKSNECMRAVHFCMRKHMKIGAQAKTKRMVRSKWKFARFINNALWIFHTMRSRARHKTSEYTAPEWMFASLWTAKRWWKKKDSKNYTSTECRCRQLTRWHYILNILFFLFFFSYRSN